MFQQKLTESLSLYKLFPGEPVEQISVLLGENRTPMTLYDFLIARVRDVDESDAAAVHFDRQRFRDNYFTTADMFIVGSDGSMLAVPYENKQGRDLVHSLRSTDQLVNWSLPVDADVYETFRESDGVYIFTQDEVAALRNTRYALPERREAFWKEFAFRGEDNADDLFDETLALVQEARGGSVKDCMGVFPSTSEGMRLVWRGYVDNYSSDASSDLGLSYYFGRLVGVVSDGVAISAGGVAAAKSDLDNSVIDAL